MSLALMTALTAASLASASAAVFSVSDAALQVTLGVAAFGMKPSSIATLSMPGFCATCTMLFSNTVTNRLPFSYISSAVLSCILQFLYELPI